jgi:hypothetical protein
MIRPERPGDGSVGFQNIKVVRVRACVRVLYNDDDEKSVGSMCQHIYTIRSVVECVCVCVVVLPVRLVLSACCWVRWCKQFLRACILPGRVLSFSFQNLNMKYFDFDGYLVYQHCVLLHRLANLIISTIIFYKKYKYQKFVSNTI